MEFAHYLTYRGHLHLLCRGQRHIDTLAFFANRNLSAELHPQRVTARWHLALQLVILHHAGEIAVQEDRMRKLRLEPMALVLDGEGGHNDIFADAKIIKKQGITLRPLKTPFPCAELEMAFGDAEVDGDMM